MGCFGGGGQVEVPAASPQQLELQNLQLQQAKQSIAQNAALQPLEMQALGIVQAGLSPEQEAQKNALLDQWRANNEQYKANPSQALAQKSIDLEAQINAIGTGGYRRMTEQEQLANMTPAEQLQYQNTMLQQQRLQAALKGELPVDPALEKNIADEQAAIQEQLSRDLGPNWSQSTAGIQRMGEFNKRAELLRESARRGEINTGTGLALNQMGYLGNNALQKAGAYGAIPGQSMGYAQNLTSVLNPYLAQQQMGFQANMANAANEQAQSNAQYNALGSMIGMAGGAAANKWMLGKQPTATNPWSINGY